MSSDSTNDFQVPTQAQLNNLMEGCYVRVQDSKDTYWVEIEDVNPAGLTGVIHTELEQCDSASDMHDQKRVCFHRDQITHVGCDRYCFC